MKTLRFYCLLGLAATLVCFKTVSGQLADTTDCRRLAQTLFQQALAREKPPMGKLNQLQYQMEAVTGEGKKVKQKVELLTGEQWVEMRSDFAHYVSNGREVAIAILPHKRLFKSKLNGADTVKESLKKRMQSVFYDSLFIRASVLNCRQTPEFTRLIELVPSLEDQKASKATKISIYCPSDSAYSVKIRIEYRQGSPNRSITYTIFKSNSTVSKPKTSSMTAYLTANGRYADFKFIDQTTSTIR